MPKLNQILAIEKGAKSQAYSEVTRLHKLLQKPALLNGLSKAYTPKDEDGDVYPPESQRVQLIASEILNVVERKVTEYFDLVLTKDTANADRRCQTQPDALAVKGGGKPTDCSQEHHTLQPQVQYARSFGEDFANRGIEQ